jgi:hypothetical protein
MVARGGLSHPAAPGDWRTPGIAAARLNMADVLVVPNMQFIDYEVENLFLREYLRREMDIAVIYGRTQEEDASEETDPSKNEGGKSPDKNWGSKSKK